MKNITILGSTGSIGRQTLEVIRAFPQEFKIIGLTAGNNIQLLKKQIIEFKPLYIAVKELKTREELGNFLSANRIKAEIFYGEEGLTQIATLDENHLLIVAISGTAPLIPTYEAIKKQIPIGLACKEVLVSAGEIIIQTARKYNTLILPIDSEHAAIKQCLSGIKEDMKLVEKIILTASGGPFWNVPYEELNKISLEKALAHPKWVMGPKITIDSATLMNKGLEVIEASHLFNLDYDQIQVIIHPQSIIHSMVEFNDGTLLAQMSLPDMRFPIQYALTYPEKMKNSWPKIDLETLSDLQFIKPDLKRFPLLELAYNMGRAGGTYPVVMNVANEAAVNLFLTGKIPFLGIPKLIIKSIEKFSHSQNPSLNDIVKIDKDIKHRISNEYK